MVRTWLCLQARPRRKDLYSLICAKSASLKFGMRSSKLTTLTTTLMIGDFYVVLVFGDRSCAVGPDRHHIDSTVYQIDKIFTERKV